MHHHVFRYIGIAAIVLLLIGLAGWYFFLRNQEESIADLASARGFGIAIPSFTGSRSSTSENIAAASDAETALSVQTAAAPPRLWRVSTSPVAGAGFITASSTLRYVERSTGHVYDVDPATGAVTRRTNTLMPKIYDAAVAGDGSMLFRTLDKDGARITMAATLGTTTDDGFLQLDTADLGATVLAVAASPARSEMLLMAESADGAELVRSSASGPQQLLSLFLTTLKPILAADGRVFLAERPASGIAGSAYEVVQGALVPLVRSIPGLAVLPRPASQALLYSADDGARLHLFARTSADAAPAELSLQTTAEKCVWAPAGGSTTTPTLLAYCAAPQSAPATGFTDLWKRGAEHTADAWFTIDISAAKSERFFIPESSIALDVERPMIDARGEYLAFINARDKSLWLLRIAE